MSHATYTRAQALDDLCAPVLRAARVAAAAPDPERVRALLDTLTAVEQLRAAVNDYTGALVDELRDAGASWSTIAGDALGVSKQAAAQRFGRRGDSPAADEGPTLLDELTDPPATHRCGECGAPALSYTYRGERRWKHADELPHAHPATPAGAPYPPPAPRRRPTTETRGKTRRVLRKVDE